MSPVIAIRGLCIAFGEGEARTQVLRDLDLEVAPGEFVAVVGSSGVGKSTLLRVLIGLVPPSAGVVDVHPDPAAERAMALVFQDARLLPWRRVLGNVALGLEKTRMTREARRARALTALAMVGLKELAGRWPHQISGGQRQRVALARALCVRPAILLMDEPFSALDAPTREALQDQLVRISAETGKTVLFVTHDIEEAVYLADRVVALGGAPGQVRAMRAITAPHPRQRDDPALRAIAAQVRADLAGEAAPLDWVI